MKILDNLFSYTFHKKGWHNISSFCNRKRHPSLLKYKPYRRGKNRCLYCGAKIGKIKCERKSYSQMLNDNLLNSSPLISLLHKTGVVRAK